MSAPRSRWAAHEDETKAGVGASYMAATALACQQGHVRCTTTESKSFLAVEPFSYDSPGPRGGSCWLHLAAVTSCLSNAHSDTFADSDRGTAAPDGNQTAIDDFSQCLRF